MPALTAKKSRGRPKVLQGSQLRQSNYNATLTGLRASTVYFYQVVGDGVAGAVRSFRNAYA